MTSYNTRHATRAVNKRWKTHHTPTRQRKLKKDYGFCHSMGGACHATSHVSSADIDLEKKQNFFSCQWAHIIFMWYHMFLLWTADNYFAQRICNEERRKTAERWKSCMPRYPKMSKSHFNTFECGTCKNTLMFCVLNRKIAQ